VPAQTYCFSKGVVLLKPDTPLQILIGLFFCAVGIQLIYFIVFLFAFNRRRSGTIETRSPVSILVCAHDEEKNLKELIPLLQGQNYPSFEVIIVNDRSNDGTYDFLLEETKRNPKLRMVHVDRVPAHVNGKKFGITLGIKAAVNEWILLIDADCRPVGNSWIETMSRQFDDRTQFVLGFSPYHKLPGFLNLFIRFESFVTALQYFSFALLKNPYMGVGRNLAYRKSLFLEKKGFNQFLGVTGGDDDLFVNQHATGANTRVDYSAESHVFSKPKTTWSSFFHQKVRHLSVGKRYRFKHRLLLGVFMLTWIFTWLAGLVILIIDYTTWPVAAAIVFRTVMLLITIGITAKKIKVSFALWVVPFLDFLYSIYYISTGLTALLTKKIRWRK
jgi:cellulose synthase/poly-beta-1,6-N-acetylglucosamine synthase-like glycosyltransferase